MAREGPVAVKVEIGQDGDRGQSPGLRGLMGTGNWPRATSCQRSYSVAQYAVWERSQTISHAVSWW